MKVVPKAFAVCEIVLVATELQDKVSTYFKKNK